MDGAATLLDLPPPFALQTADDDPRVGHLLGTEPEAADVVLVGFPSDEGVRRNGGRAGAAAAPDAIRAALYRLTPDARQPDAFRALLGRTVDLGSVRVTGEVGEDQQRLGRVLAPHLARGAVPVVLGGGHESAFGHFLGYAEAGRDVAILNWDAHPDVRPLLRRKGQEPQPHSGSPFRQALTHPSGHCTGYRVAGLLPQHVAPAHLTWLQARGARFTWGADLTVEHVERLYADCSSPTLVTFDVDAVDQAYAPGVSAPATGGLQPNLWLTAAYHAGRCPHVTSIDVAEVNPRCDVDGRTVRLAALTVWTFLRGLAQRLA